MLIAVAGILLCAVACWTSGYLLGHRRGHDAGVAEQAKALAAARANAADLAARLQTMRAGLADVRTRLQQQIDEHQRLVQRAEQDVATRDQRIADLQRAANQRAADIRKETTDESCQPLADLPVCPAVARRLWPHADHRTP
ncbi:hypothetical protein MBSD_n1587 [Mizugakiibacter sediminis]|nr:hypothetical protein MBSD_n1587 [Mizugakiibacter sediminis]